MYSLMLSSMQRQGAALKLTAGDVLQAHQYGDDNGWIIAVNNMTKTKYIPNIYCSDTIHDLLLTYIDFKGKRRSDHVFS